jgi:glycosyltransferase 2 family protein
VTANPAGFLIANMRYRLGMSSSAIRRSLVFAVKVAISAAFLGILLFETRTASYFTMIFTISPTTIATVIGIVLVQMAVISALRLTLVMRMVGHIVRAADAARITWCGFFFEQIGAVFVAGDVARIYLLRQVDVRLRAASEGVLIDRAIGFVTIGAMAVLGIPELWWSLTLNERRPLLLAAGWSFCALIVVVAILVLTIRSRPARWLGQLHAFVQSIVRTLAEASRPRLAAVVLLAISTHGLNVIAIYLLLRAVGVELSLATCFVFVPSVLLASTLPASISGWGVREGALVLALNSFGVPSDPVVTASVLFGLCVLIGSLPGAVIWLSLRRREREAAYLPVNYKSAQPVNDPVRLSP